MPQAFLNYLGGYDRNVWNGKEQISLEQKNNIENVLGLRLKSWQQVILWRALWAKKMSLI